MSVWAIFSERPMITAVTRLPCVTRARVLKSSTRASGMDNNPQAEVIEVNKNQPESLRESLFSKAKLAANSALKNIPFISDQIRKVLLEKSRAGRLELSCKSSPAVSLETADSAHLEVKTEILNDQLRLETPYDQVAEDAVLQGKTNKYPEFDTKIQTQVSVDGLVLIDASRREGLVSKAKELTKRIVRFTPGILDTNHWVSHFSATFSTSDISAEFRPGGISLTEKSERWASISVTSFADSKPSTLTVRYRGQAESLRQETIGKRASAHSAITITFDNSDGHIVGIHGFRTAYSDGTSHELPPTHIAPGESVDLSDHIPYLDTELSERLYWAHESEMKQATVKVGPLLELITSLATSEKPFLDYPVKSTFEKFEDGEAVPNKPHPEILVSYLLSQSIAFSEDVEKQISERIRNSPTRN